MQAMRLYNACKIPAFGPPAEINATVHENIVKEKIDETVTEYAKPCCESERIATDANIHQDHRRNGEDNSKPVVFFKHAVSRFVMRFMQAPEPSMHHVFMSCPGDSLHEQDESGNDEKKQ